ncbi:hypothetical protein RFI_26989 [Reticulomyxa filosa]|uniref:Nodulin-like domain-containing protein n=1 Tax=Reticulomyxa filosa TaxID=46433 RepID=X6M9U5_RETFI|nr:hypothetical protein RFI_26989 [Reticulomyxa filosa]|eukprot:ETO10391.1 hypothetical protein RFI_26989 [Reticulomyxa filosa]
MKENKRWVSSRWVVLGHTLILLSLSGTAYAFGLISDTMKDRLSFTQTEVNVIATLGNFGLYLSIIPGLFINRHGTFKAVWTGTSLVCIGWLFLYAFTAQWIDLSNEAKLTRMTLIAVANFTYQQGNAWFTSIGVAVVANSFPVHDRPALLAMTKGYIGISSAFVAEWKLGLANNETNKFMMVMLLFIPATLCLWVNWQMRTPPTMLQYTYFNETELGMSMPCLQSGGQALGNESHASAIAHAETAKSMMTGHFWLWYVAILFFGYFLALTAVLQAVVNVPASLRLTIFALTLLIWVAPVLLSCTCHGAIRICVDDEIAHINSVTFGSVYGNDNNNNNNNNNDDNDETDNKPILQVGLDYVVRTSEYYLLFFIFMILAGTGLTFVNNVAQLVESLSSTATVQKQNDAVSNTNTLKI